MIAVASIFAPYEIDSLDERLAHFRVVAQTLLRIAGHGWDAAYTEPDPDLAANFIRLAERCADTGRLILCDLEEAGEEA